MLHEKRMKHKTFFTTAFLLLSFLMAAQEPHNIQYPYNPDVDNDEFIATADLTGFLAQFGQDFQPAQLLIDTVDLLSVIQNMQDQIVSLQNALELVDTAPSSKYLALVQFNAAEDIASITMVDPSGSGVFTATGVTTSITDGANGERFADFQFANEYRAPASIVIYAADMINSRYRVTHVNAGGDNLSHRLTGATFSNIGGYNYSSDLFSQFGNSTVSLDLSKSNLDYVRDGIPPEFREAHAYILFQF